MANWLNTTFQTYDFYILEKLHMFADATNGTLNGVMNFISLLAEKGIMLFLIAIVLMAFRKTRKLGICMFGAICCGALITNFTLKDMIARQRPYQINHMYELWHKFAGAVEESDFSFPSGHTTAAMAAMTSIFLICKKKYSWTAFIFVVLIGISRNYLMVHFPSDILGGILVGGIAAIIAYYITNLIYYILNKYAKNKLFKFILNFDIMPKKTLKVKILDDENE